jgi:hypothetical protein
MYIDSSDSYRCPFHNKALCGGNEIYRDDDNFLRRIDVEVVELL